MVAVVGRVGAFWYEPLDSDPTQPALCPHGCPWAIRVVYDDPPLPSEEIPHDA